MIAACALLLGATRPEPGAQPALQRPKAMISAPVIPAETVLAPAMPSDAIVLSSPEDPAPPRPSATKPTPPKLPPPPEAGIPTPLERAEQEAGDTIAADDIAPPVAAGGESPLDAAEAAAQADEGTELVERPVTPAATGTVSPQDTVATTTGAAPVSPSTSASLDAKPELGAAKSSNKSSRKFPHRGTTFDLRLGTQGCVKRICSQERHAAVPGFRIDGFLGGNIGGFVELGFSGGWGTLGNRIDEGTNALSLYGIDVPALERSLASLGGIVSVDLDSLNVQDASLRTARVGPLIRVHFIPRGRFLAYVGSGVGYSLFRAKYQTNTDRFRIDFHGMDVPIEGGFAYQPIKNLAVGIEFNYLWARYFLANLNHPDQRAPIPVNILDQTLLSDEDRLSKTLPQLWTLSATVRARF